MNTEKPNIYKRKSRYYCKDYRYCGYGKTVARAYATWAIGAKAWDTWMATDPNGYCKTHKFWYCFCGRKA
jgi:hypothetical protein